MSFKVTTLNKVVVIQYDGILDIEAVMRINRLIASGVVNGGAVIDLEKVEHANDGAIIKLFRICKDYDDGHAVVLCNTSTVIKEKIARLIGPTRVGYRGNLVQAVARLNARRRKKSKPS